MSDVPAKTSIRDAAIASLRRLPADASIEDMQYRLYVLEKIRKSEESFARDGAITHDEAKRRFRKWLSK